LSASSESTERIAGSWLVDGQPAASISPGRSSATSSGINRNRPACWVWIAPSFGQSSPSTRTFSAANCWGAGSGLAGRSLGIRESPSSRRISHTAVRDSGVPARSSSETISSIP
jgi:hypothetical protein